MPLIDGNPNSNAPVFPDPSLVGSLAESFETLAVGFGNSIKNVGDQLNLTKPEVVAVKSGGTPWTPWTPRSDPAILKVYGQPLPVGIVLTHCFVRERVSYRPYPLSAVSSVPLVATFQTSLKRDPKTLQVIASNSTIKLKKDKFVSANMSAVQAEQDANYKAFVANLGAKKANEDEINAALANSNSPDLAAAGVELGKARLEKRVGKVYISDIEPRSAELRLVLHDVIAPPTKDGAPQLSVSRYALLETLWTSFCRSPHGAAPYKDMGTVMSDAARINAENSAGHLVQLGSMGLDPYNVDTWLTADFQHQEIPNLDVIVVKISLTEFFSTFSTGLPTSAAPPVNEMTPVAPAAPSRPSYLSQAGLA